MLNRRLTIGALTAERAGLIDADSLSWTHILIGAAFINVDAVWHPVGQIARITVASRTNLTALIQAWQIYTGLIASAACFPTLALVNICNPNVRFALVSTKTEK